MPAISIITPLFNKGPYIAETIASVQAQTFSDWEWIVVDDFSTDAGPEVVRACAVADRRITLLTPVAKGGPGAARNAGLDRASGEWVQFLDADDLLEPSHLEEQLATAARNPTAEIVASSWQEFRDGQPANSVTKTPTGLGSPPDSLRNSAIAFAPWAVHAALVKRESIASDHRWPEALDRLLAEDIAFWFRLVCSCLVGYSPGKGALYRRMSPDSRTDFAPDAWFRGVHAAVLHNLDFLRSRNQKTTAGQCENLMRLYTGVYRLADRSGSQPVMRASLAEAERWLAAYFQRGRALRWSMILRRLLGLRWFLRFSTPLRPEPNTFSTC